MCQTLSQGLRVIWYHYYCTEIYLQLQRFHQGGEFLWLQDSSHNKICKSQRTEITIKMRLPPQKWNTCKQNNIFPTIKWSFRSIQDISKSMDLKDSFVCCLKKRPWYLAALGRASSPASHSWAQMDSFSFEGLEFGISSPSLSIFSPLSTNSFTSVALSKMKK